MSDCMQETYDFISQNLEYFHLALQPAREALSDDGSLTFISHETQWSLACRIDRSELGKIAQGEGSISEGGGCSYDKLLEQLSETE